ncbi:MAG: four helix bundle protein [Armatimonadota bacterium]|nr:four helix bundle protein [Armatimonadota bacterium]
MSIGRFEDIEAWKKARGLTGLIYQVTSSGAFARDYGLCDQIRRASVSIMSNIAEGFERGGDKEFRQFLSQAKGSAGEVKAQLYVAFDAKFLTQDDFNRLYNLATESSRLTAGFMRYLATSSYKGNKFQKAFLWLISFFG